MSTSLIYLLFLLFVSEIIEARYSVKWRSSRCAKFVSEKPKYNGTNERISAMKCFEYTWQVRDEMERQRFEVNCNRQYGIAGGKVTGITEYPHMAAIGWKTTGNEWLFSCGGSIISPNFVLTAAHCTKSPNKELQSPKPKIVRLGVTNIYEQDPLFEKPVDKNIVKIIVHPKYASPKKNYDIALIKIDEIEKFSKYVHPACLSDTSDVKDPLYATGWGLTEYIKTSSVLKAAALEIIHPTNCKGIKVNRNWKKFAKHQLCAGKLDGSAGTCNGDSGAPLQYRIPNQSEKMYMYSILAITSFGNQCKTHNQPLGVYVNINSFLDWIEKQVWPSSEEYNYEFL